MILMRTFKDAVKQTVSGTILEKPLYKLKVQYDIAVMNKWGKNYVYDKETEELISRLPKDANCIDIGCHKGDILRAMIECAPEGNHIAFEPIPELYDSLLKVFPCATIHKKALSTKKGKTKFFNVISGQGVSGLQKRKFDREHEIIEIEVEIDTLDNLIYGNNVVALIKIDVEGGEFDVMKGGKNLILRDKPIIIFEFEKEAAEKYNVTADQLYDFVTEEIEMEISLMKNWLKDAHCTGFSRSEFQHQFNTIENFYFIIYSK
jgi:FkbM family methyltransferase